MSFGKILLGMVVAILGIVGLCYIIALDINYVCTNWNVNDVWGLTVIVASILGTFIASSLCITFSGLGLVFAFDGATDI